MTGRDEMVAMPGMPGTAGMGGRGIMGMETEEPIEIARGRGMGEWIEMGMDEIAGEEGTCRNTLLKIGRGNVI